MTFHYYWACTQCLSCAIASPSIEGREASKKNMLEHAHRHEVEFGHKVKFKEVEGDEFHEAGM
jgi:hypothetical protein